MPNKRIVVCCDGTSNTAFNSLNASPHTNVYRIWRYTKTGAENGVTQMKFYQSGLGTAPGSLQTWNQAWAIGLQEKVMEAYTNICGNYEVGDEIILIGYSRGAYTVRCLIALIVEVGFLTAAGLRDMHIVFKKWWENESREKIRQEHQFVDPPSPNPIKACGLWDTVSSVGPSGVFRQIGIPWWRYTGPDSLAPDKTRISGVEFAFHALSLHESRSAFRPSMMSIKQGEQHGTCKLEQCWFSGYHGDIGGGRRDDALAHLALAWMMARLKEFVDFDTDLFWNNEVPNSSWSLCPETNNAKVVVADTMTTLWRPWGTTFRLPGQTSADQQTHEYIHRSVYQLTFPYAPRPPVQVPPLSSWILPPVFAPCESLKGVSPLPAREPPAQMTWTPRYEENSYWPYETDGRQLAANRVIDETKALSSESALIKHWVQNVHMAALKSAKPWDEERNPLLTILPDIDELLTS